LSRVRADVAGEPAGGEYVGGVRVIRRGGTLSRNPSAPAASSACRSAFCFGFRTQDSARIGPPRLRHREPPGPAPQSQVAAARIVHRDGGVSGLRSPRRRPVVLEKLSTRFAETPSTSRCVHGPREPLATCQRHLKRADEIFRGHPDVVEEETSLKSRSSAGHRPIEGATPQPGSIGADEQRADSLVPDGSWVGSNEFRMTSAFMGS